MFRSFRPLLAVVACSIAAFAATPGTAAADVGFLTPRETSLPSGSNTRNVNPAWPLGAFRGDGTLDIAASGDPVSAYSSRTYVTEHGPATPAGAGAFVTAPQLCSNCDYVTMAQNSSGDAVVSYFIGYEIWVRRRIGGAAWSEPEQLDDAQFGGTSSFTDPVFVTERDENGHARFLVTYHEYSSNMNPDGGSSESIAVAAVATGSGAFAREAIGEFDATAESSQIARIVADQTGDPVIVYAQYTADGVDTNTYFAMRRLGADTQLDAPVQLNAPNTVIGDRTEVDVAFAADGSMMATWVGIDNPGYFSSAYPEARHMLANGTWETPSTNVRLTSLQNPGSMNVTALPDGTFSFDFTMWEYPQDGYGHTRAGHIEWDSDSVQKYSDITYLSGPTDVYGGQVLAADVTGDGTLIVAWSGLQYHSGEFDPIKHVWAAVREPGADDFLSDEQISGAPEVQGPMQIVVDRQGGDAAVLIARRVTFSASGANSLDVIPYDGEAPRPEGVSVAALATTGVATTFDASDVTDTWSQVTGVEWEVNGQSVGTDVEQQYTFSAAGTFAVTAVLTDAAGNSRNVVKTVTVVAATVVTPPTNTGGGSTNTGGGQQQSPAVQTPVTNEPPKPTFTLTSTVSTDKMPALVGLKVDTARDRLDRAGIQADLNVVLVHQATAPRGIAVGEVMTQLPAANTPVTSAIRDAEPVTLRVYAGPANKSVPTKKRCSTVNLNKALKGVDLDMAAIIARSMACDVEIDVKIGGSADPAVTGVTIKDGQIVLSANAPKSIASNDLFLVVRESATGNYVSFNVDDWSLTAHQRNAFTIQVVDRAFRLVRGAKLTYDVSGVGSFENLEGTTNVNGEQTTTVIPTKGGVIDVLAQVSGADGKTIYGTAQLKVADRSNLKNGTKLYTTTGRTFAKQGAAFTFLSSKKLATAQDDTDAAPARGFGRRTLDAVHTYASAKSENLWDRFCNWLGNITKGTGKDEAAFTKQNGQTAQETIQGGIKKTGLSPAQLLLAAPLLGGNLAPGTQQSAPVVAAGGANVVAAGGGNVIAAGGANVVAAGGGNVVAAGGGNVIAAGGGNVLVGSGVGVIAPGGGNVIAAGGGNVIAAGGGNVIAAGGGNVIAAGGLN